MKASREGIEGYVVSGNSQGFTLVELVVVAAIIGVVSLVAVTNIARKSPEYRLKNASWQITSDLRLARMEAISQNTEVEIDFNNSQESYSIWVDSDRDGVVDSGEQRVRNLSELSDRVDVWAYPETARFTPQGYMKTTYSYWHIRLYMPNVGYKYVYVFENGHIDPEGI